MKKWFDIVLEFLPAIISVVNPALIPIATGIPIIVNDIEKAVGPGNGLTVKLPAVQKAAHDLAATANAAGATINIDSLDADVAAALKVGLAVVNLLTKNQ